MKKTALFTTSYLGTSVAACLALGVSQMAMAQETQSSGERVDSEQAAPETQAQPSRRPAPDDDFHRGDPIVVTAPFVRDLNLLSGTSEISGDELSLELRGQIGDSLTKLPGVSATSFAPGASRPILRGFQGERVRVLNDGIGSIDASNTSADHGVTIDPLLVERVEVLRGPAVLLFGGQAVGGAVNAIDKRIPRGVPEKPFHLDALATYGSASNERSIGSTLDVPVGDSGVVVHVDGSYRKSDDLEVGGFVLSPDLRSQQLAIAAEEEGEGNLDEAAEARDFAGLRGRVPNTATESYNLGASLAWFGDGGMMGVSVGYLDSSYGVPARPGAGHHGEGGEEEGPVTIALEQLRVDYRGEVDLPGFFEKLRLRAAYGDYEHIEFEGDEIGTRFLNTGLEARAELVQAEHGGWRGASGVQFVSRDFNAIGAEAFVPPSQTTQLGLFTLQELQLGDFEAEGALRYDKVEVDANTIGQQRSFDAVSAAIGLSYKPLPALKTGFNVTRSERAPSAEELFSNGPHIATQAFEIGNPNFDIEKSWGGEIYVRYDTPDLQLSATVYANDFSDFIIDLPTANEQDGLPVFQYIQGDARYYGLEFEGSAKLTEAGAFDIIADAVADYTNAKLKGVGPVPRIPPLRLLGGIEAQSDALTLRGEVEWFDDQNRVAASETPTAGFTLVNASLAWKPLGRQGGVTLLASANNIFDVVGRRAASFTKDFVPISGRDLRVSAKFSF